MNRTKRGGFTLIEVLGALLVFSMGVLMTLNLTDSMGEQLRRSGVKSELLALARTQLDSLEAEAGPGLAPFNRTETVTVAGQRYTQTLSAATYSPLVVELQVRLEPSGGRGPRQTLTSYVSGSW
jgi:prepilin-type N-terminal cleavage/methylation domain-containing protein